MQTMLPPISIRITKGRKAYYVPPKPVWGRNGLDYDYDGWTAAELKKFREKSFTEAQAKEFLRKYLTYSTPIGTLKMLLERAKYNLRLWCRCLKNKRRKQQKNEVCSRIYTNRPLAFLFSSLFIIRWTILIIYQLNIRWHFSFLFHKIWSYNSFYGWWWNLSSLTFSIFA